MIKQVLDLRLEVCSRSIWSIIKRKHIYILQPSKVLQLSSMLFIVVY